MFFVNSVPWPFRLLTADWGSGQPLFFHHGWPLSADDWDAQMMFFLSHGYRVIAHDRRGHGRSTQTAIGHDLDTYAADVAQVVEALDLENAIHIGHSTGGGEVTRHYHPVLWFQPARCKSLGGHPRELVASRHDGRHQGLNTSASEYCLRPNSLMISRLLIFQCSSCTEKTTRSARSQQPGHGRSNY